MFAGLYWTVTCEKLAYSAAVGGRASAEKGGARGAAAPVKIIMGGLI